MRPVGTSHAAGNIGEAGRHHVVPWEQVNPRKWLDKAFLHFGHGSETAAMWPSDGLRQARWLPTTPLAPNVRLAVHGAQRSKPRCREARRNPPIRACEWDSVRRPAWSRRSPGQPVNNSDAPARAFLPPATICMQATGHRSDRLQVDDKPSRSCDRTSARAVLGEAVISRAVGESAKGQRPRRRHRAGTGTIWRAVRR